MKTSCLTGGKEKRRGVALIAAMIFMVVFMALSVGMLSMSSQNMLAADNLHSGNLARSTAESGLELVRYWMQQADTSSAESQAQAFGAALDDLHIMLAQADVNFSDIYNNGQRVGIAIQNAPLERDQNGNALRTFDAVIQYDAADTITMTVTGNSGSLSRTLQVGFGFESDTGTASTPAPEPPPLSPLFGYGVATKGPLNINGNAFVSGYTQPSEGSVFIDGQSASQTFYIDGSAKISGEVGIANPNHTTVKLAGNPWINGSAVQPWWPFNPNNFTEQDINNRGVYVNVGDVEFPTPNPQMFRQYATGPEITGSMSSVYTLDNAVIKAGTNPTFTGIYEVRGVLYIEQPNKVTFGGSCTISAIIVAEGDHENGDATNNKITWSGHVTNNNVQNLPDPVNPGDPDFSQIRQLQGVSVLAPGFELNIGATYNAYERFHGSIVGNGIKFTGDPTLVINGTVINYSNTPMSMGGSTKLYFDNQNIDTWPDGLEPVGDGEQGATETTVTTYSIRYNPASYAETPCGL